MSGTRLDTPFDGVAGVLGVEVDERDLAALAGEVLHDGTTDAVAPPVTNTVRSTSDGA